MGFHESELLRGAVVKHSGAGSSAVSYKPEILAEVVEQVRFSGALRPQFNHVKTGFNRNQEARNKLQLSHYSLRVICRAKAVGIVLHGGDEKIHPLFRGVLFPGLCEILKINRIRLEWPV